MKLPLSIAALLSLAASAPPAERVVIGDGATAMTLEGVSMSMRIDAGAPAMPVVAAPAAARAGLKGGMFGSSYRIGPGVLGADTAVADLAIGLVRFKRRVAWAAEPFASGYDGVIGPGGLPEPVVRFVLGPAKAGERTMALPLDSARWNVSSAGVMLGGIETRVRFDPQAPRTVATAAVGHALATAHRGTFAGEAFALPIAFGVTRPVRELTLAQPVAVGPFDISRLAVRVADGGAVNAIPEAGADLDEVRVVAKGKPGRASLLIGADLLGRCSSLVFDKPKKQIRLTCL